MDQRKGQIVFDKISSLNLLLFLLTILFSLSAFLNVSCNHYCFVLILSSKILSVLFFINSESCLYYACIVIIIYICVRADL